MCASVIGWDQDGGGWCLAASSDRDPDEPQRLRMLPASHPGGGVVHATYRQIGQVRRTRALFLAGPYWTWGGTMGVNESGVAMSAEPVPTDGLREAGPGLIGPDLLRLALERSDTAEEAAGVVIDLLLRHGQSGRTHSHRSDRCDHSFLLADPRQAWVLETVGRDWALRRLTGAHVLGGSLTITRDWDRAAERFRREAAPVTAHDRGRPVRGGRETAMALAGSDWTAGSAMAALRSHGSAAGGRWSPATAGPGRLVCAHAGPGHPDQATGAIVVGLGQPDPAIWVTGTAATCLSIFFPVWLASGMPSLGPDPQRAYDPRAWWWRHEDLHRAVLRDFPARRGAIAKELLSLQQELLDCAEAVPARAQARRALSKAAVERIAATRERWGRQVTGRYQRAALDRYALAWERWDRAVGRPTGRRRIH